MPRPIRREKFEVAAVEYVRIGYAGRIIRVWVVEGPHTIKGLNAGGLSSTNSLRSWLGWDELDAQACNCVLFPVSVFPEELGSVEVEAVGWTKDASGLLPGHSDGLRPVRDAWCYWSLDLIVWSACNTHIVLSRDERSLDVVLTMSSMSSMMVVVFWHFILKLIKFKKERFKKAVYLLIKK